MAGLEKKILISLTALGCRICPIHPYGCQFLTACSGALCEVTLYWGSPLPASVGFLYPSEPAEEKPPNLCPQPHVLQVSISPGISDASAQ